MENSIYIDNSRYFGGAIHGDMALFEGHASGEFWLEYEGGVLCVLSSSGSDEHETAAAMMTARIESGEPCSEDERREWTKAALELLEDIRRDEINMDDQDLSRLIKGWQEAILLSPLYKVRKAVPAFPKTAEEKASVSNCV